jgi:hypothetical protein
MPKKKVFAGRNLKGCLPSLPLKTGKQKEENQIFFISSILCFPVKRRHEVPLSLNRVYCAKKLIILNEKKKSVLNG